MSKIARDVIRVGSLTLLVVVLSSMHGAAQTASEIWRDESGGQSRHIQSGLACPAQMLSDLPYVSESTDDLLVLGSLIVGDGVVTPGDRVACEYESKGGGWAVVEIQKLDSKTSVSDFYGDARKKVTNRFPDAWRQDLDLLPCKPKRPPDGRETYCVPYNHISVNGKVAHLVLVVGDTAGWAISLTQFKFGTDDASLHFMGPANWTRIAHSRNRQAFR